MDDEIDFIVVKGKLPKTNKDGSPTIGHLGAGGLRREDGTVERLVQDLEPVEDPDPPSSVSLLGDPFPPPAPPERFGDRLARAAVEGVMSGVGDSIRQATGKEPAEALVDYIDDRVRRWWRERRAKKNGSTTEAGILSASAAVDTAEPAKLEATAPLPEASDEDGQPPLTRDEAELLYREMLKSAAVSEALRRRLSGALVHDEDGKQILGDVTRAEIDQFVGQALETRPDVITEILSTSPQSEAKLMCEELKAAQPDSPP